jgi:hypothetical protein
MAEQRLASAPDKNTVSDATLLKQSRFDTFAEKCKSVSVASELRSTEDDVALTYCLAYLDGIIQTVRIYQEIKPGAGLFCVPQSVSTAQAAKVILQYAAQHPESLHEIYPDQVVLAFMEAFPCSAR